MGFIGFLPPPPKTLGKAKLPSDQEEKYLLKANEWGGGLHWPFNCAIWTEAVYSGISENMEMFSGLEECEQSLEQAPSMETLKDSF